MHVDVILPVHNPRIPFLNAAIDSIRTQTYPDWRLIIIEDGSGEPVGQLIQPSVRDCGSQIVLTGSGRRAGPAGARMQAIAKGRGEWLAFIDQDDIWMPDKLERQIAFLRAHSDADAVHSDIEFLNAQDVVLLGRARRENGIRRRVPYNLVGGKELAPYLAKENNIRLVSAIVRRTAFDESGGFDASLFGGEDWEFWVRFAVTGHNVRYLPEGLMYRREHGANTSRVFRVGRIEGHQEAMKKVSARYPELREELRWRANVIYRRGVVLSLGKGKLDLAEEYAEELIETKRSVINLVLMGVARGAKIMQKLLKKGRGMLLPYYVLKMRRIRFHDVATMVRHVVTDPAFKVIRSNQNEEEIRAFLMLIEQLSPRLVMEIGTARGGTLFMMSRVAAEDATLLSLDIENPLRVGRGGYERWRSPLYRSFARARQRVHLIRMDSHSEKARNTTLRLLEGRKLDCLFIDGDHSYEGVRRDFEMYSSLVQEGGVVAFHDIVPGPAEKVGGVPEFWQEVKRRYPHKEFVNDWSQERYGIGVVFNVTSSSERPTSSTEAARIFAGGDPVAIGPRAAEGATARPDASR